MSYVTPPTFVAGATLAAADLNDLGDDIVDHEARLNAQSWMAVFAVRTADQLIPDAAYTYVNFALTDIDLGNWWTSGTDVIVPAAAIPPGYTTIGLRCLWIIRFASNAVGSRRGKVFVNGTGTRAQLGPSLPSDQTSITGFDVAVVSAGDVVTLGVYQNSGASLNLNEAYLLVERAGPIA